MKNLLIIFVLSLSTFTTYANTCVSLGNGDWNDPLTWSCGAVPSPGDTIIINAGDTVTLNSTEILYGAPMVIMVNGYFLFDTPAAKLHLECGSVVIVSPTGEIASSGIGTPSHNIKICGQEVWAGADGSLLGPVIIGTPLPIELLSFDVEQQNFIVSAYWVTSSEYNNEYFTLQGSEDASNWNDLLYVDGAGTTSLQQNYSAEYDNRTTKYAYYRLKQTDIDGSSSYSKIVSVQNVAEESIVAFPNPMNGDILNVQWKSDSSVELTVSDINGRLILNLNDLNSQQEVLNVSDWNSGVYFVSIVSDVQVETVRLIKP